MADGPSIIQYLEAGLRAAGLRSRVISSNLANLGTRGFERSEVRFEELLARATESGGQVDLDSVRPEILQPHNTPINEAGNDVDLDVEIGELVKNSAMSKVYLRTLAKMYSQMELAMKDQV